jgi:hypothetical protein
MLVKEYLTAQELGLLGENGMSDANQMFVEKDDISCKSYLSLRLLMSFVPE